MQEIRRIIVAVTAGIAAYKSVVLVRGLVSKGFDVQVVMTEGAKAFIQPLTFQALSGNLCGIAFWIPLQNWEWGTLSWLVGLT